MHVRLPLKCIRFFVEYHFFALNENRCFALNECQFLFSRDTVFLISMNTDCYFWFQIRTTFVYSTPFICSKWTRFLSPNENVFFFQTPVPKRSILLPYMNTIILPYMKTILPFPWHTIPLVEVKKYFLFNRHSLILKNVVEF